MASQQRYEGSMLFIQHNTHPNAGSLAAQEPLRSGFATMMILQHAVMEYFIRPSVEADENRHPPVEKINLKQPPGCPD
jgi:hypothetical protein